LQRPLFANKTVFIDNAPDYVRVAIDPGSMRARDPDCFLTVRNGVSMSFPSTPQDTSFDAQAAFCETDLLKVFYQIAAPVVYPTLLSLLSAIPGVAPLLAANLPSSQQ